MKPVVVAVAITSPVRRKADNPAVPVMASEQVERRDRLASSNAEQVRPACEGLARHGSWPPTPAGARALPKLTMEAAA